MPNLYYRIIRLTTPNVNYLLAVSGGCLYISVLLFTHPVETVNYARAFCNVRLTDSFKLAHVAISFSS